MAKTFYLRNRIGEVRTSRKLTQAELGKAVDTSEEAIESFEKGSYIPSARIALAMCLALDCSFEDLFYPEYPENRPSEEVLKKIY